MVFNTISVGAAVTPAVVKTCASHYLNRKARRRKPTAHISYDEGLNLIRHFLQHAALHTVEDLQAFTSQWVPSPRWVKVDEIAIPQDSIGKAADALGSQLGHKGIDKVGGSTWWQWRRDGNVLMAEWIEMRGDYERRHAVGDKGKRVMLYVHGGAYFFGSVDEHRYQMQRHARKLQARVFARLLVILRDQGLPLPAGAILISPWVDLTHSFPSVAGDSTLDYIPAHGFLQKPSAAWPPPNADDMEQIAMHAIEQVVDRGLPRKLSQEGRQKAEEEALQGLSLDHGQDIIRPLGNHDSLASLDGAGVMPGNTIPGPGHDLSIMIDSKPIKIKDQIQMYATNHLISHPLVSPVLQPSLGGLPPLLILTGGGEVLRDEQIYLAHKAANPSKYPPGKAYLDEYPDAKGMIAKWKPTNVQLQVWDDLCHVAPTLSFTRPAKYMYRSIAQFGAWALARAQKTEIDIPDDDEVSIVSSDSNPGSDASSDIGKPRQKTTIHKGGASGQAVTIEQVGKAGDPLPPYKEHMIRQRVDRHGTVYPLGPTSSLPALQMPPSDIGVIKPGPVRKWMAAKKVWDKKFAKELLRVQKQRAKEMAQGYEVFGNDEVPPPSALAGRRGLNMPKEKKKGLSWGMSLWSLWGSAHDEKTVVREEKVDKVHENNLARDSDGVPVERIPSVVTTRQSRSRSRRRTVTDAGQTSNTHHVYNDVHDSTSPGETIRQRHGHGQTEDVPKLNFEEVTTTSNNDNRPTKGAAAYPFKLGRNLGDEGVNASTCTLTSQAGVVIPSGDGNGRNGMGSTESSDLRIGTRKVDEMGNPPGANQLGVPQARGAAGEQRPELERFQTAREQF